MATILAYTSPALGHLLPMSALMVELASRGHTVHVRTLSAGLDTARHLGFVAEPIDPRIEAIQIDDWQATNPREALKIGVAAFGHRAEYEITDLADAVRQADPDALLIDVNCWGAQSLADSGTVPWASFAPYTVPLRADGVPPFGLGLPPRTGPMGRIRDAAVRAAVVGPLEKIMLPPINRVRAKVAVSQVDSMDEFLRRASLILLASGKPFQYPATEWGDAVQMIGPCVLDRAGEVVPDWLGAIDRPIILVTTSSEKQADADLVTVAVQALAHEPVHVVATMPAGLPPGIESTANATVCEFVPHALVLDRAVCAVTHGGMGATQKALARGIPVCVVPYGRDQLEVARRVEVARCGTRLPARRLTPDRLRDKVREAMRMADGARRVAAGFAATGGVSHGADVVERRLLGRTR
ncbi:glycosyltransferase [Mycolicibacterium nivoides]|uniref:Glycosyltransferase n=1 Tax=Mycolicibacterium nivoides TaxID=2487344 RepID=A0ABW9LAH3_9MYCO|nr:nucleotide disphospho-sugar-binding domain-containing protein [Mycolicibacterium nivoides]SEQ94134.1 glycosyltransferase, MGT family [Mycobacterium sp. 88mf]SFF96976.1 glycosyltransferase, MGT family [Mycobacterium sp. 455mf]